jgi:hypothetical protein
VSGPSGTAPNTFLSESQSAQFRDFASVAKTRNLDAHQISSFQQLNIGTVIAITGVFVVHQEEKTTNL